MRCRDSPETAALPLPIYRFSGRMAAGSDDLRTSRPNQRSHRQGGREGDFRREEGGRRLGYYCISFRAIAGMSHPHTLHSEVVGAPATWGPYTARLPVIEWEIPKNVPVSVQCFQRRIKNGQHADKIRESSRIQN